MNTPLETKNNLYSDREFQRFTDRKDINLSSLLVKSSDILQKRLTEIILETGGIVTVIVLLVGAIALSSRQIVYTTAPLIIEHVTTEAVDSLRL